jgi:DNA-binding CsgD family transcriptional regulator
LVETTSELAERLVRRAAAEPESGTDVLVDVEFEGVRCVVARVDSAVRLSRRELEIARMVAEGHPNKTIAAVLEISTWTVNTYMRRIFAKLGVSSRAAMVAKLMRMEP